MKDQFGQNRSFTARTLVTSQAKKNKPKASNSFRLYLHNLFLKSMFHMTSRSSYVPGDREFGSRNLIFRGSDDAWIHTHGGSEYYLSLVPNSETSYFEII